MPTFRRGNWICHSNAPPPKINIYYAPMIKMVPNDKQGFLLSASGYYQHKNFRCKSYAEVNAILIGNGYMFAGEEIKNGKHIRYYAKVR